MATQEMQRRKTWEWAHDGNCFGILAADNETESIGHRPSPESEAD